MVKVALLARLEAKPGKEEELAALLKGALSLAENEPATVSWFAFRIGKSTFGIFDTFNDEAGRQGRSRPHSWRMHRNCCQNPLSSSTWISLPQSRRNSLRIPTVEVLRPKRWIACSRGRSGDESCVFPLRLLR